MQSEARMESLKKRIDGENEKKTERRQWNKVVWRSVTSFKRRLNICKSLKLSLCFADQSQGTLA